MTGLVRIALLLLGLLLAGTAGASHTYADASAGGGQACVDANGWFIKCHDLDTMGQSASASVLVESASPGGPFVRARASVVL